eukprot:TRINITY_DN12123_c0_g1_i1.p1 TRINITY_DN12123_c0_g1~~TRINITY_DN12123_c0_g1_i1.p1  ORF type:complete len:485 (-),score=111.29 TRINITY_DN12123_c0_g1_i1:30-1391(-)
MKTSEPEGIQPPIVKGNIPFLGAGLDFVKNPTKFLNEQRKIHGDIFLLHAFGVKMFFVFSKEELIEFYKVPEKDASFNEATRGFLGYKVPEEILSGTMKTVLVVLKSQKEFSSSFDKTIQNEIANLPETGKFEIFAFLKSIVHKVGFNYWIGDEAANEKTFNELVSNFNAIDPEQGFKDMSSLFSSILNKRSKEREALYNMVKIIRNIVEERRKKNVTKGDFIEALLQEYKDLPVEKQFLQSTIDILVLHMASQANLYAAISWTIINLIQYPSYFNRIRDNINELKEVYEDWTCENSLKKMELLDQCFNESIRLAQQSLTLRLVMNPVNIGKYKIVPGYYIATLLSCLNVDESILPNASKFAPEEHYENGKIKGFIQGADYSVSAFGFAVHHCPGKKFATISSKIIISHIIDKLDLTPDFTTPKILETQMGAVGRTVDPCFVSYKKIDSKKNN